MLTNELRESIERELPDPVGIGGLALFLGVDYRTIYREVVEGNLPAKKKLGEWAIRKVDVLRWLSGNSNL